MLARCSKFTVDGSADALLVAPVVSAVAIEVRQPRAGLPVLGLLSIRGASEAWLFAGVYRLSLRRVLERMPRTSCDIWTGFYYKSHVAYHLEVHPDRVRFFGEGTVDGVVVIPVTPDALERHGKSFAGPPPPWAPSPIHGRVWRAADAGCSDL